ncbi:bifunctional hydroxymethylpyrimidine kinase/phosphomethylpyrimidine kinase [Thioclava atlantica]|uniref:hydroxymethylpyrimidine kinase n=1 Tax=Thioclava atlantica TaxID=1317124 RepID=A0A085TU21_9RHOB|nr:hydroxymethylpyrimidine/phosphomethylpyrimidine kinase [Thioclava atlantica]KFE34218.1 phosphomethylpyrimidine kinase ThiD [Thioclava atlantica]
MSRPVLFIGGLDSSGGAGILRDTATAAELGAPARVALTSVTAQSDHAVTAIHPVPSDVLAAQIDMGLHGGVGAVKIGMLGTRATVETVADRLPRVPVVLDPVLRSSSGRDLIDAEGRAAMVGRLLPRATLLTPNIPELQALAVATGLSAEAPESTVVAELLGRGCGAVLVKGGHGVPGGLCEDRLYTSAGQVERFARPWVRASLRGTGCQLASAIAVHLGRGLALADAVARARDLLQARFEAAAS